MKAVIIILSALFIYSCKQAENNNARIDELYLRHSPAEWDSLFNAGNSEAVAALYTNEVISMPYDVPSINGIKAQQQELKNLLQQYPGVQHYTMVDEILIDDSFAIERAHYTMTFPPSANDEQVKETGRHIMCRKKINGKWKIAWEIWNRDKLK